MSNINKRLNELAPHVLGIRFTNNLSVVDTFFKEGWLLPKSDDVGNEPVPEKANYYMLYPKDEEVGVDEMLDYVAYVINVNVEREKKIELLQIKIKELKEIFSKSSLKKCETLTFKFSDLLSTSSFDEDESIDLPIIPENKKEVEKELAEVPVVEKPIDNTEVKRFNTAKVNNEIIDLPPKKGDKIVVEEFNEPEVICKCDPNDPNQGCPVCLDY